MQTLERKRHITHQLGLSRHVGAAIAGLTAFLYFLLGFGLITAFEDGFDSRLAFTAAGFVYLLGAYLLWEYEIRAMWTLGAMLQTAALAAYFGVAWERSPSYDFWGIMIAITQMVLLAILVSAAYLTTQANKHDRPIT